MSGFLSAAVVEHASRRPEATAVVDDVRRVSYSQLAAEASHLAGWLSQQGMKPGAVLSVQLPNVAEFVISQVAADLGGFIFNPLSPRFSPDEVAYVLHSAGSGALISSPDVGENVEQAAELAKGSCGLVLCAGGRAIPGTTPIDAALSSGPMHGFSKGLEGDSSTILMTSGSEDRPKLVLHTQASFRYGAIAIAERCHLRKEDAFLLMVPASGSTGTHGMSFTSLLLGAKLVMMQGWDVAEARDKIQEEACTYTIAPTAVLYDLVRTSGIGHSLPLRLFICGGAPIPEELIRDARKSLGCNVSPMYGASECLAATAAYPDDEEAKVSQSDGKALFGVELRTVDEKGRLLGPGEVGEILVKGPTLFKEYIGNKELTNRVLDSEGWFHSGDLGRLDEEGYVKVVDRLKDVIVRGGLNISSLEVERAISKHPQVEEVGVVAIPDERLGERACAFVVSRPSDRSFSLEDLIVFLREQGVAKYKWPEKLVFVEELPKTPTGKVSKRELRFLGARLHEGQK